MENNFFRFVLLVSILGLMAGCADQRILEKQGFLYAIGYDWIQTDDEQSGNEKKERKEQLGVTAWIPIANARSGKQQSLTLQTVASTSKEGKFRLSRQTELSLVSGQLRTALFSLPLASKGLMPHLDTLLRDPSVSQRLKLAVVDGTANAMLKKVYPAHMDTGPYIDHLLEKESHVNNVPMTTLYCFIRDYMDDGVDPVVPLLEQHEDHIEAVGIALFDEDRYVSRIGAEQAVIFAFLKGPFKYGEISIDLIGQERKGESVMFNSLISSNRVKIKPIPEERLFRAEITIKVEGALLEYIGDLKLSNETEKKKLEDAIADAINIRAQRMLQQLQKLNVDSIGMGKHVRNSLSFAEWKQLDWDSIYPRMEIRCGTKVEIKTIGKIEK